MVDFVFFSHQQNLTENARLFVLLLNRKRGDFVVKNENMRVNEK